MLARCLQKISKREIIGLLDVIYTTYRMLLISATQNIDDIVELE